VAAGVAMRNLGYGTVTLNGIPAGSTVYGAYLLWDVINNSPTAALAQGSFDDTSITGVSIGTGASPCWPSAEEDSSYSNFAYEANVTSLVKGNGSYDLSGFASGATNGEDPWEVGSPFPELDGGSLVVIYKNPSSPSTTVQLYGGASETDSGTLLQQSLSGFTASSSPSAQTTFIVGDGQALGSSGAFNGTTLVSNFLGADPQAVPKYSQGNLWDTDSFNVGSLVNPGDTSETATVEGNDDCIVWVGQAFSITNNLVACTSANCSATASGGGTTTTVTCANCAGESIEAEILPPSEQFQCIGQSATAAAYKWEVFTSAGVPDHNKLLSITDVDTSVTYSKLGAANAAALRDQLCYLAPYTPVTFQIQPGSYTAANVGGTNVYGGLLDYCVFTLLHPKAGTFAPCVVLKYPVAASGSGWNIAITFLGYGEPFGRGGG
jgi:hypothetical protein